MGKTALRIMWVLMLAVMSGCSVKQYSVNMVADLLATEGSVYETDDDVILVGEALPFSLKLVETLIRESPGHQGLLITASRGYVLYSYAYVHHQAEVQAGNDIEAARVQRRRARSLYMRAHGYALRALEISYPGIEPGLAREPRAAVLRIGTTDSKHDVAMLYWSAVSLGLAISVSKNEPALIARLPEVEALLRRALEVDESWRGGTLHEFAIVWAGARRQGADRGSIRAHYDRAVELSGGMRAGLYVAYAEAVAVPTQDREAFLLLMEKALAVDDDLAPDYRLLNAIAKRRARWLLARTDELILE